MRNKLTLHSYNLHIINVDNMKVKVTLCLLSIFALASCVNRGNTEVITELRKVKWEEAKSNTSKDSDFVFSGKVLSANDLNLSFRVAGVVEFTAGKNGTFIKEGDLIATLDSRDYAEQLNATRAEWEAISGEANRVIALWSTQSVSENDYNKAVSALKQITAKLNIHQSAFDDTRLVAPFDGYIQKLHFDAEEAVGAGMPVVSFIGAQGLELVVNIPYSNYINRGRFVKAVASSARFLNEEFALELIGMSPKANLNQLHETRFVIKSKADDKIVAGMSVVVTMRYAEDNDNSVTLPLSAVVERDNKTYVWTISDENTVDLREVRISNIKIDGNVVISDGIKAGERVVCAGVGSLKQGQRVTPMTGESKTNIGGMM